MTTRLPGDADAERRGAAFEILSLCKFYGTGANSLLALDDFSLRIFPGEWHPRAIRQPCGKY
jgi:hypothetical protein